MLCGVMLRKLSFLWMKLIISTRKDYICTIILKKKRTEFSKHVDTQGKDENDIVDYAYVSSPDGKYLIGHRIENLNDMDATKPGTTRVYFYNIQTRKKTWVAFLMKHTKLPGKNQNLIDYYESPFILQHVAEMVGK